MDHLAHLKTMVETRRISGSYEINMENYNERIQVTDQSDSSIVIVPIYNGIGRTRIVFHVRYWRFIGQTELRKQKQLAKKLNFQFCIASLEANSLPAQANFVQLTRIIPAALQRVRCYYSPSSYVITS